MRCSRRLLFRQLHAWIRQVEDWVGHGLERRIKQRPRCPWGYPSHDKFGNRRFASESLGREQRRGTVGGKGGSPDAKIGAIDTLVVVSIAAGTSRVLAVKADAALPSQEVGAIHDAIGVEIGRGPCRAVV